MTLERFEPCLSLASNAIARWSRSLAALAHILLPTLAEQERVRDRYLTEGLEEVAAWKRARRTRQLNAGYNTRGPRTKLIT
jgi:hypothetical protein